MPFDTMEPSQTGLVLFDMLNSGFRERSEEVQRSKQPMVDNCVRLMNAARETGMPIFYPKADHRADSKDLEQRYIDLAPDMKPWPNPENRHRPHGTNVAGNPGGDVIDELEPAAEDYVIPKHRWNAFFQTKLELSMRARGIGVMVLCGGAIEVGIASTAYAARDLDLDIVFVRDACHSGKPGVGEMFMDQIFSRMGRVRSTDEAIAMLHAGAAAEASR
jgi:nicotinamidase-related amidase